MGFVLCITQLQPPERLMADLACRPQFQMSAAHGKSVFIVMRMASDRGNYIQGYSGQAVIQAGILQEAKEVLRQGVQEVIFSFTWPRFAAGVFSQLSLITSLQPYSLCFLQLV